MGLAVAKSLAAQGSWHVHLLDINADRGIQATQDKDLHPHASFHKTNVSVYSDLAAAFQAVFQRQHRVDFVFANAGIIEKTNFFGHLPEVNGAGTIQNGDSNSATPPQPDLGIIDANLNGVMLTSYLALHYFRRSPDHGKGANLVMTASCGGLYPSYYSPLYTASKREYFFAFFLFCKENITQIISPWIHHMYFVLMTEKKKKDGVVGFMRSIAPSFWHNDGIRVNAICPGIVQTNLVDPKGWAAFPSHTFIALETISRVVLMLLEAHDPAGAEANANGMVDATGTFIPASQGYGRAVEISGDSFYFREAPDFCDQGMREIMAATVVENQVGGVLNG